MASKIMSKDQKKFLELFLKGLSVKEAAEELGLRFAMVRGWCTAKSGAFYEGWKVAKWIECEHISSGVLRRRALGTMLINENCSLPSDYAYKMFLERYGEGSIASQSGSPLVRIEVVPAGICPEVE